ncbi:MAG TPA: ice-binding family protein [Planctomycetaceae bacterium]|jgi:hypothetical protein|nr:ice-binding family protein [Planctomycetaceae bacterium]
MTRSTACFVVLLMLAIASRPCQADQITLGDAAKYALFAGPKVNSFGFNGPSSIIGNVAVGENGKINFASPATIVGTLYEDTGVTGSNSGVVPTGGIVTNFSLSSAVTAAQNAATNAAALTATGTVLGNTIVVTNPSQSVTFNGSAGQNVLKVTDLNLNNGNFTIHGTANETFIIDVSGKFIVNGSANILLTGGVTADHVLFDITGTGQDVSITGNTTSLVNGTILALSRNISIHDQTLDGAIIGAFGNSMTFSIQDTSGFQLNGETFNPPINPNLTTPAPSSFVLFGSGLLGLVIFGKLRRTTP